MLVLTLFLWAGLSVVFYHVHGYGLWQEYGGWLPLMIGGTFLLLMDVKLAVMMMRHEEKKKWKRYKLNDKTKK